MVFFHPSRDVRQAAWDPCSYRWIIWSKWEIELCVISIEMVGEAMCLYDGSQWCSVCGEEEGSKNRSLGNPSDQFMCFGYLPSPGHPERPTSEIGFKPAKWNPSDIQWWEGGQEDLMIDSVKSGKKNKRKKKQKQNLLFCYQTKLIFSDRIWCPGLDLIFLAWRCDLTAIIAQWN